MRTKQWDCDPYRVVLIEQTQDLCELLVIGPLHGESHPNSISQFHDTFDSSIKRSEKFVRNVADAIKMGFSIMDRYFRHEDGREIHVSNALDTDRSQDNFISLLGNSGA
ncbi:hypothetical protein D7Z26_06655 [Cohnella endophytica]|uniref:Uncharacterized protein n=1 Tax=Cohnella endophytica TaxID=2419778 RepID=A0A494Y0M4_9BACL|nr:hypothetical protein [Cohnella endophytica]RKP56306.1 hypothetical protein D7Z26_06655 [Cohnella endophytica]